MVRVFLSHSTPDDQFVHDLSNFLEQGADIKTWADHHDIAPGHPFVSRIETGLEVDAVLVVLSPDAVASPWVDKEWHAALASNIPAVPVLCRECKVPKLLAAINRFDATKNRLDEFPKIKTWLLSLRQHAPPPFHAPSRPPLFVGREAELEALWTRTKEEGSLVPVEGLPGLGKTTLALEFAHRHKRDFEAVYWLQCVGRDLAALSSDLASQLGVNLEGDLEKILHHLRTECARKRCLLVLDNVDDEEPGRLVPDGRASVLVTTRRDYLAFLAQHDAMKPQVFTEKECFDLFRRVLGEKEVAKSEAAARVVFERLGYLPIAISVAAGLIKHDIHYTIDNLPPLEKFVHGKDNVSALFKDAIAATGEDERKLLAAMAVCAPEGFRLSLAAEVAEIADAPSIDALQGLISRSLAEELDRGSRRYRLHALIRTAADPPDALRMRHADAILQRFDQWEKNWRECEQDLGDLRQAFGWTLDRGSDAALWNLCGVLAARGFALTRRIGRLPEAHEFCDRRARAAAAIGDKHALQVWYGNQALVLQVWGRLEEALAMLKKKEVTCEELGNRNGLCTSYGNQALILRARGQLEEALALNKKVEAICEEFGDRDGFQACYCNQAIILMDWGRLEEALALLKKQEVICDELGNRDGLQICYGNQAMILRVWGRLEEALALHKKEEAVCEELGNRDGLQRSYGNQAVMFMDWERLDEAMALLKKQEAISEELGNREGLQASYGNQAGILKARGRREEAMALLMKGEAICLELGLRNELAHCYWNLAHLARERGDLDEARTRAQAALAIFTELKMPRQTEAVKELLEEIG
ncbi:MAG TPA: TIR domain-containing protein [Bryobacteraceae bacterium]|nr:TIR domain-containing protein [Bryobacteraceae bacterium]